MAAALGVEGDGRVVGHAGEAVLADVVLPRPREGLLAGDLRVTARRGRDRWGRERLALEDAAGGDVAARLVEAGIAVVDPAADGPAIGRLLALEAVARDSRRGVWGPGGLAVRPAGRVRGATGELVHVEGRVLAVGWAGDRLYINFGEDRRRDFTVRVERATVRAVAGSGLDLAALAGRNVLVRGWLIHSGGPMVEVTGPAQVEVLP